MHATISIRPPRPPPPGHPPKRFFAVSILKLILMSVCTFGLYEFYWFYEHWTEVKDQTRENLSPFWRAIFSPLFCYSLFTRIKETSKAEGVPSQYSSGWAAIIYIALFAAGENGIEVGSFRVGLPSLTWENTYLNYIIPFLTFLPLVSVQRQVNNLHRRVAPHTDRNAHFSVWNIGALVVGGAFVSLSAYFGLFGGFGLIFEAFPTDGRTLELGSEVQGELTADDGNDLVHLYRGDNHFDTLYVQAWGLDGRQGDSATVDLISGAFDAYLVVVGPGLSDVLEDDDGGGGCNARISLVFPADTSYRVIVSSMEPRKGGAFTLRVSKTPAPRTPGRCGG